MLGLGSSLTSNTYSWGPGSVPNLTLWLAVNKHIEANQDNSNASLSPVHSSNLGTMDDLDQINKWGAHGNTTINAVQTTQADKPRWEADAADFGGAKFVNAADFLDLSAQINCSGAFTMVVRMKPTDLSGARAVLGHLNTEFFQINNNKVMRVKVDNNIVDFEEVSDTLSTTAYTTVIITRNSSAQWNAYVKGGGYATETQWGTANQSQAGTFTMSNVGCRSDDVSNFVGFMKDVLVYNGTALSSAERALMFDYIDNQQY